ncbi:MAG: MBL fold metallo-hydrolase [bacterium]|nr:MBL fold metallo-hydrolase [bacterium]
MKQQFSIIVLLAICLSLFVCSTDTSPEDSELVRPTEWWENLPRPVYANLEQVENSQWWFEVYKLPGNIFAIYEPNQFEEIISYLVQGEDKALLIDTGLGIGNMQLLVSELTDLPVIVVNTHTHFDHIGSNHQFDEVMVFDNETEKQRLKTGITNDQLRGNVESGNVWKGLPEDFNPLNWKTPPVEITRLLKDGDIIDLGNKPIQVIHTPGHSPGHICLLDKQARILFTGDIFYPGPLYAFGEDVNIDDYIDSISKLTNLCSDYDYVCPAHNEAIVKKSVIPKVNQAFIQIFRGRGKYEEDAGIRRYYFGEFDIIIQSDIVKNHNQ